MLAQRTALEKLGYTLAAQSEKDTVAIRRKWYWECLLTNLTFILYVREVDTLTAAMIEADTNRMIAQAPQWDPSSLPRGFQKGRAVIAVYLAGQVAPDAVQLCNKSQKPRFASFFFPAALDRSTNRPYYLHTTPLWGGVYYGKFRYAVQRLIDPANAPEKEPLSIYGLVVEGLMALILLCSFASCIGSLIYALSSGY